MKQKEVRLAIVYKNFAVHRGISHIGLGVTALTNAKILNAAGFQTDVWPVVNNIDIVRRIRLEHPTHVVIQAPWLSARDVNAMVHAFPRIQFAVISHSNIGFLQADPNGVRLLREYSEIVAGSHNFHIAGNSKRFVEAWRRMFKVPVIYLPNLYYSDGVCRPPRRFKGGVLRIGAFGAVRPLKNFLTAASAALMIAHAVDADLELWFSSGRSEGGGDVVWRAIEQMFSGLPRAKVIQAPWASWPRFRETVRHMHLLLQPSYTESFNMVTADGITEGVPSVVSTAIDWAPKSWKARHDDAQDMAKVGVRLLKSRFAVFIGRFYLWRHNRRGLRAWKKFLRGHGRHC